MGPGEIIIYVVLVVAAGAIIWLVARPKKELPPGKSVDALGPGASAPPDEPADEAPADEAPADEAPADDTEAATEASADDAEVPPEEAPGAEAETPEVSDTQEPADGAAAEEAAEEEPAPEADREAKPAAKALPRFAPPPTFAPPPSFKKAPKVAPPEVKAPEVEAPEVEAPEVKAPEVEAPEVKAPEPEVRAPVPMPVDKPKVPTREEREQAELEAKKSERERYRKGLKKTKGGFIARLARLFKGKPKVSDDLKDDIEEVLFTADIGAKTAEALLESVTSELDKREVADPDAVWAVIRQKALDILEIDAQPLDYEPEIGPYTLLMIGVNGVGKTTTIGKLAARHVDAGRKTLMVAGDTFRAAAGEQLEVWARRVGCDIHMGKDGADPSSVLFDGITRGRKEGYDVILCDTAGRLHTRKELMDELEKMGRAASKALSAGRDALEPHDTFLVLDATIGQNALAQAQMFKETMSFTGLVLTKLDGTAKGGVVLGVVDELNIPIRYIGIGEAVDDLRRFDPEAFCEVLFQPDEDSADANDANDAGDD